MKKIDLKECSDDLKKVSKLTMLSNRAEKKLRLLKVYLHHLCQLQNEPGAVSEVYTKRKMTQHLR